MKKITLFAVSLLFIMASFAQPADPSAQEAARNFMKSGDRDNAILVLNRAVQADPQNLQLQKDLTLSYYYKRAFSKALELAKGMMDRDDADVVVFQIAGNVYKALEEVKDAEKMYKKALRKFPKSGPLYSEYGELLWANKDVDAIREWEKGIEVDPNYAGNYYNAAVFYYYTKDKIWTILYGEIFVNMEYLTERATLMKKLILSTYKEKLFADISSKDAEKSNGAFTKAVQQVYNNQASVVNRGISSETLNMLRTRFVLDWFANHAGKFPFRLFEYHQQLIKEGMFEAYNQWLFGTVDNLLAFEQWTRSHADAYGKFTNFQKGRVFKLPQGQYYKTL